MLFLCRRDVRPGFLAGIDLTPLDNVRRFRGFKQYGVIHKGKSGWCVANK